MKTTNLFIDFIIIGAFGILGIVFPFVLIDINPIKIVIVNLKSSGLLIALVTILVYSFGIFYNQLSDQVIELFKLTFFLKSIKNKKEDLKAKLGYDYHNALQRIVLYSKNSFEYLSYRRTMLRIIRSFIFTCFLIIILHVFYSLFMNFILGDNLNFSLINLIILLITLICGIYFRSIYIKLYNGYLEAIINFALLIEESDEFAIQN